MNTQSPKKRRTPEQTRAWWQLNVEAQQASGLSQAAYCQQHGLDKGSLSQWKTKLAKPAPATVDAGPTAPAKAKPKTRRKAKTKSRLVPVVVKADSPTASEKASSTVRHQQQPIDLIIKARLPNGIILELLAPSVSSLSTLMIELARVSC
jgi:hypothetical protein